MVFLTHSVKTNVWLRGGRPHLLTVLVDCTIQLGFASRLRVCLGPNLYGVIISFIHDSPLCQARGIWPRECRLVQAVSCGVKAHKFCQAVQHHLPKNSVLTAYSYRKGLTYLFTSIIIQQGRETLSSCGHKQSQACTSHYAGFLVCCSCRPILLIVCTLAGAIVGHLQAFPSASPASHMMRILKSLTIAAL